MPQKRKIVYKSSQTPGMSEREIRHINNIRELAADCMVLLKNDGSLPLKKTGNIALYGAGGRNTIRGGGGSGTTCPRFTRSVEEGLEEAGFIITTKAWLDRQDAMLAAVREKMLKETVEDTMAMALMTSLPVSSEERITSEDAASSDTDTAVYVLARNAGEGDDRQNVKGGFMLLDDEQANIDFLAANYKTVIVILNTCGVMDMNALQENAGVNSILSMGMQGSVGGLTVADVLVGKRVPSGKLADTWGKSYDDYATAPNFGYEPNTDDVNYEEGIYVGYRYFDTFGVDPVYPFGFGLGYTDFSLETKDITVGPESISLSVEVTNTGKEYSGKEIVQIYASAPAGNVEKPYQELVGFGKTRLLAPGEKQTLTITFRTSSLASYDDEKAAWVLEAGDYFLRVGNSSRNTCVAARITLDQTAVTQQLINLFADDEPCDEITAIDAVPYSYLQEEAEKAAAPVFALCAAEIPCVKAEYPQPQLLEDKYPDHVITAEEVMSGKYTVEELTAQLTIKEMADFTTGDAEGLESLFDASRYLVPGSAAQTTDICLDNRDIRIVPCSDGPAGLHTDPEFVVYDDGSVQSVPTPGALVYHAFDHSRDDHIVEHHYAYCTAFPTASTLAQAWDPEVLTKCGDMYAVEMKEVGMPINLMPSMNIHRDPLGGRNFEYYSEDPLVAGICASAVILSIQKYPGLGNTAKHFAANSQERNRFHSCSHVSERALREIYLKGFEIACRTAQPACIMTSYNLINGIHSANNRDLLTQCARNEWHWEGMFMTDWFMTNSEADVFSTVQTNVTSRHGLTIPHECTYAGNDIVMPGSPFDRNDIIEAVESGKVGLAELQNCTRHVLTMIFRTDVYENSKSFYDYVKTEPFYMTCR